MRDIPVALALYTVAPALMKDYRGTLDAVKAMGYTNIELGGKYPYDAAQWKRIFRETGFGVSGHHYDFPGNVEDAFETICALNLAIGNQNVLVSALRENERQDREAFLRSAERLNALGRRLKARGLCFFYHNHAFEFVAYGDKTGYELLLENTDPAYVSFQLDTYWVAYAGLDPARFIKSHADRIRLLHIKDMLDDGERSFGEIGEGMLDFAAIFRSAEAAGISWFAVEQDKSKRDCLESAKISHDNIARIKKTIGMG